MRGWVHVVVICLTLMCHSGTQCDAGLDDDRSAGAPVQPKENQLQACRLLKIPLSETRILERVFA